MDLSGGAEQHCDGDDRYDRRMAIAKRKIWPHDARVFFRVRIRPLVDDRSCFIPSRRKTVLEKNYIYY
jgi:hypothetical protein